MTVTTEIENIKSNISNVYNAVQTKGAILPSVESFDDLPNTIQSINGAKGLWIALASNKMFISQNGVTWFEQSNPNGLNRIAYGKGYWDSSSGIYYSQPRFIGLKGANTTNIIKTTTDGIYWRDWDIYFSARWSHICCCDEFGFFGIIARGSSDFGLLGVEGGPKFTMPTNQNWGGFTYGDYKFIAANEAGNRICRASVATSQTEPGWSSPYVSFGNFIVPPAVFSSTNRVRNARYLNGKFYIIGQSNNYLYSSDGNSWSIGTFPTLDSSESNAWFDIAYGKGKYIAINRSTQQSLAISTDGINWTKTNLSNNGKVYRNIIYANNKFIITGENTASFYYSEDGTNWKSGSFPSSASIEDIAYGEL
jgi:hypothetical protein